MEVDACGWLAHIQLTTLVSYWTGIQRKNVSCPHNIHPGQVTGTSLWPSQCISISPVPKIPSRPTATIAAAENAVPSYPHSHDNLLLLRLCVRRSLLSCKFSKLFREAVAFASSGMQHLRLNQIIASIPASSRSRSSEGLGIELQLISIVAAYRRCYTSCVSTFW